MSFLWIVVSLIIFTLLVLVHEYGHYKTSRIFWVHIEEFGLGIPPRAKKLWKNKSWTLFSLNWIPLWGFVKIHGESEMYLDFYTQNWEKLSMSESKKRLENEKELFNKKWTPFKTAEKKHILEILKKNRAGENFFEKNIFQKSLILLAGIIMNIVTAYVILVILFIVWVKPVWVNTVIPTTQTSRIIPTLDNALESWFLKQNTGIILFPIPGSLAEKSWLREWDILQKIWGKEISDIEVLQKFIQDSASMVLESIILRDWEKLSLSLTVWNDGKIWSYLSPNITRDENYIEKYNFLQALYIWWQETYTQFQLTFSWLAYIVSRIVFPETPEERTEALSQVAWPIGIVQVITLSLSSWLSLLLVLSAMISISLAVFNLLPIPALDGWRLLFLWIRSWLELFLWKKTKLIQIENMIHVWFFMILIALSVLIAYNDIIRIFWN